MRHWQATFVLKGEILFSKAVSEALVLSNVYDTLRLRMGWGWGRPPYNDDGPLDQFLEFYTSGTFDANNFQAVVQAVQALDPSFVFRLDPPTVKWDGTIELMDGKTFKLDFAATDIDNEYRLPHYLLFRQPLWREDLPEPKPGDYYLVAAFGFSVLTPDVSPYVTAESRVENAGWNSRWTVVQLDWYNDFREKGPYIRDIRVYREDGTFEDTQMRERAARIAARAAREAAEAEAQA